MNELTKQTLSEIALYQQKEDDKYVFSVFGGAAAFLVITIISLW